MKEKIARWYAQGLWTADMVRNAVEKKLSLKQILRRLLVKSTNS